MYICVIKKNDVMTEIKRREKEKIHSNKIRMILEEQGMSQQELADLALMGNSSFLSRIINGQKRCLSLTTALRIAKALNKQVEDVFVFKIEQ